MSFFPSADPDEERTPYVEQQSRFPTHDAASFAHLANTEPLDYNFLYAASTHALPASQSSLWAPAVQEPQGLGLQYPSNNFMPGYTGSTTISQPAQTSFTWPADFTPTQTPLASMQSFRRDSCSDACGPPSTVQPSQLWEPFQPSGGRAIARDLSPGRSEYSTSSYPSTASSPFVHPDSYHGPIGSPLVKTESEPVMENSALFQDIPSLHEPSATDVRDFASSAGASSQRTFTPAFVPASASNSEAGDVKPSLRPGYRRAYSAADTRDVQFISRRKRSLTRPENANCSCDVCGKLFQRCYNLKAHMETHDANRSVPHRCKHPGCGKRFVRRTDLVRHNESVRSSLPFSRHCSRTDSLTLEQTGTRPLAPVRMLALPQHLRAQGHFAKVWFSNATLISCFSSHPPQYNAQYAIRN